MSRRRNHHRLTNEEQEARLQLVYEARLEGKQFKTIGRKIRTTPERARQLYVEAVKLQHERVDGLAKDVLDKMAEFIQASDRLLKVVGQSLPDTERVKLQRAQAE